MIPPNSLRQEFYFVEPDVMMRIVEIYTMSFYGSSIYNIFSNEVEKIFSTYNKYVRSVFKIPMDTHRYFIEELSGLPHPKTLMASRLVGFHDMMKTSERSVINLLVAPIPRATVAIL